MGMSNHLTVVPHMDWREKGEQVVFDFKATSLEFLKLVI